MGGKVYRVHILVCSLALQSLTAARTDRLMLSSSIDDAEHPGDLHNLSE